MARPREFDLEEALQGALHQFWQKGYEGTSLHDLTEAMGITRPSLYAAFGNKEQLYRTVLDRYESRYLGFVGPTFGEPTARAVIEKLLYSYADANTGETTPPGCFGMNGAVACSDEGEPIRQELLARRSAAERMLAERLARAREEGDLPPETDPETLAKYVMTVAQGVAMQAKSGASRKALHDVIAIALGALPSPAPRPALTRRRGAKSGPMVAGRGAGWRTRRKAEAGRA
jgi:AcrR family transcriptional regulator